MKEVQIKTKNNVNDVDDDDDVLLPLSLLRAWLKNHLNGAEENVLTIPNVARTYPTYSG